MNRAAILLPNELKHNIAMFCTPSTLASLAQIHSSYQHEAECVLYQQVYIFISEPEAKCCLDTLSSNPEKASFLRSLTVEFPTNWEKISDESYRAAIALPTVLCHLKALSDLRIRLPNNNHYNSLTEKITDTLRNGYFQLHTLYCNHYLDIVEIIKDQRQLQFVGIYGNDDLKIFGHLDAMEFTLPTVFGLNRLGVTPVFDHIQICPELPTNNSLVCRALAVSFGQDISSMMVVDAHKVAQVSVWLKDFSDTTFIRDVVQDMILYFPNVEFLDFMLRCPSRTAQPEIKDILSLVPALKDLIFYSWDFIEDTDGSWVLPVTLKKALANEWMAACPQLWYIQFLDGYRVNRYSEGH